MGKPTTFKPEFTYEEIQAVENAVKFYIEEGKLLVNDARRAIAAYDKLEAARAEHKARVKKYYEENPDAED